MDIFVIAERLGVAMVFAVLFWSAIRRSESRAELRENRLDEERKAGHKETILILRETVDNNTQAMNGVVNQMERMGSIVGQLQIHCSEMNGPEGPKAKDN